MTTLNGHEYEQLYPHLPNSHKVYVDRAIRHGVNKDYAVMCLVVSTMFKGITYADILSLIEGESGFRNIYGHDPVRNPIKSPPGGHLNVTHSNYVQYLHYRKQGLGMQGVGPGQLTYYATQDHADSLGGCHVRYVNIRVAAETLAANIRAHGYVLGWQSYNGTGAAARTYSHDRRIRAAQWAKMIHP